MARDIGKATGLAAMAAICIGFGAPAVAAPGDGHGEWRERTPAMHRGLDRDMQRRSSGAQRSDDAWMQERTRQHLQRQDWQPVHRELDRRHVQSAPRNTAARHAEHRPPQATRELRAHSPVYADRPWYGNHWNAGHRQPPKGPVVVYRNTYHYVTVPQPVYVSSHPVYYDGPYSGYAYDDGYGYGYRRSACNSDAVGAVIGAVLGGVIGASQDRGSGPVIGGALIGAVLGGVLGHTIDAGNQACFGDVLEYVPANHPVSWHDGNSGYDYRVTPTRTYEPHPGQYCREYQTVVTIGGRAEEAYGTACRQPDGSWQTVS